MISIAAGNLRRAVKTVARACSDRSPIADWEKVFLIFDKDSSAAMATDGRCMILAPLVTEGESDSFTAVVDPDRVVQCLVACEDDDLVLIEHLGDPDGQHRITLHVAGSRGTSSSRSSIRYKPPESIPDLAEPDWSEPTAMFSPESFNEMLGLVAPVARKSRGGAMTDVVQLYPIEGNQIRCTAFDGTRLAQLWLTETAPMQSEILVPADLIKLIGGDARHTEDIVALMDDGRRIWARIDGVSHVAASVQGEFIERSREIEIRRSQATKVGTVRADHFLGGLRQAEIVLDDRAGVVGVDLRREPTGRLAMSSQSPMYGQCTCSVTAELTEDFAIAIQAPVITEQLTRLGREQLEVSVIGDLAMLIGGLAGRYVFMLGSIKLN